MSILPVLRTAVLLAAFVASTVDAASTLSRTAREELKPRIVPVKAAEITFNEEHNTLHRLVVKFAEGSGIRAKNDEFLQSRDSDTTSAYASDISHINGALKARPALLRSGAVKVERLFSRSEVALEADRKAGMARSGEELADLNLYHVIVFDASVAKDDAVALANSLIKLGVVEIAYFEPVLQLNATDIAPATTAFEQVQNHLDRAYDHATRDPKTGLFYSGIDAKYAWTFPGGRGAGMKFVDIEFGWNTNHEDLNGPTMLRDPDTSDRWHGTAVLGIINAQPNGYGMTGIASDARYGLVNVASVAASGAVVDNLARAVNRAASAAAAGDVVLIEVGIDFDYKAANCTYPYYGSATAVPVEHYQAVFDAIKTATANGIIVVETASNGSAFLDDPCFGNRYSSAFRDSGAIMVGASVKGSLQRTLSSSYGSRIDVQGQGNMVATTVSAAGFNNLFNISPPDENQQYTSLFDGTSSAGAIVAGAVLSLQGIQKARNGRTFTPAQMRTLLKTHGTNPANFPYYSQGGYNGIGVMPNLRATIDWMLADADGDGMSNGDELSSGRNPYISDNLYVVTATAGPNGTISPRSISVAFNRTAQFSATPNPGYVAVYHSGNCPIGTNYGTSYETGQIVGSCGFTVTFAETAPAQPASPTNVSVKLGDGSAMFRFTPAASPSEISSYTVSCNGGAFNATATSSPIRLTGLINGTTYSCSITAQTSVGSSAPSTVVQVAPFASASIVRPIQKGP